MDEVNIVEYDPRWQTLFAEEAERIWQILGKDLVVEIEHIGSTAVPGMAAKPVVDIIVGVRSFVSKCKICYSSFRIFRIRLLA